MWQKCMDKRVFGRQWEAAAASGGCWHPMRSPGVKQMWPVSAAGCAGCIETPGEWEDFWLLFAPGPAQGLPLPGAWIGAASHDRVPRGLASVLPQLASCMYCPIAGQAVFTTPRWLYPDTCVLLYIPPVVLSGWAPAACARAFAAESPYLSYLLSRLLVSSFVV